MADASHYAIRGGPQGRERLRVLGRVMHASTSALLDRLDVRGCLNVMDVGCGGGDVTLELARRVAPDGTVVGVDIDEPKLEIARAEAARHGVANVTFRNVDIRANSGADAFDVVYARFLLTHLSDPASVVSAFHRQLRPGGLLVVEDIDFAGAFTHPKSKAFERYCELYCATVRRRGGDPAIGPRLPSMLQHGGFANVGASIAQPIGVQGEAKLLNPLTLEAIADAVLQDGLATRDEVDGLVRELYEFAANPTTLAGMPRVVQAWGYAGV